MQLSDLLRKEEWRNDINIGLNDPLPSSPEASFGGMKQSGFGREGGPDEIYKFLSIKP